LSVEVLRARNRARAVSRQRTMLAYVLVRRGGYSVKEVAKYFGRDATTISSLVSRYEQTMQNQPELGRGVDRLAQFV
jgi:transposase